MKSARALFLSFAISAALFVPATAAAQGCALCYTQAAGSGQRMIQALKSGILVLVFPPMGLSVLITVMCYRKRNKFRSLETEHNNSEERAPNADLGW